MSRALFVVMSLWAAVAGAQATGAAEGGPPAPRPAEEKPVEKAAPFKLPEWLTRFKVWGWANVYAFPYFERNYPDPNKNLFRIRFARLVVDFSPHDDFTARLHLAGEQASSALFFDYFVTWKRFDFANVTVGQQKIMLGASISQPGFELTMLDRPKFVTQFTKQNFRDIGLTVHTGRGPTPRVFEYSVGLYNGTGRVPFAANVPNRGDSDLLLAARAVVNPAPLFLGKQARLALGVTGAVESTGVSPDATTARNNLGMALVPWATARTTYLLGADLNVSGLGGLWLLGEVMFVQSEARPAGTSRRMLGWYVELGYTLPVFDGLLQPVARFEWADPDTSSVANEEVVGSAGLNVRPFTWLLVSAFYSRDALITPTGVPMTNRVELRLQARY
ncbi:MAG: porin [Archangium sp.]|nr:porin [Archangium sp.]